MNSIAENFDPGLASRLDPPLDAALADSRVAGVVVLVAKAGKLAYARAVGLADIDSGRPMQRDTIFRAASLTKPLVTAAALSLVEDGILALEDPVTRLLPDFKPRLGDQTPAITIRQLLTHTAGLSYGFMQPLDGPYPRLEVSDGMDQPGLGFTENLGRITEAGLFYPPGAGWIYSVSMDVLGAAMEQAADKSLQDILVERVTSKLGLADTGFRVSDRARLATAYADGPPPKPMGQAYVAPFAELSGIRFAPDRIFDSGSFPSAGAGAACSALDFLTFLETIRGGGGPVVSAATVKAMLSNQTGDLPTISGPGVGFGFGGAVIVDPAAAASPHSAGTWRWGGVYGHSWFVDPAREISFVLMTNTALEGMSGRLSQELMAVAATA
ncbi:MAG TPA: serine hydrolase domain-containing protein [Caulobacteraceae bacterium]|jgi:CubicO group peptidase (beta-lactamase class C family)|nr:serine hydrolase domain-containing protein [Caulobacteraceae bacterium]